MNISKIPFVFPAGIELTFVVDPAQCNTRTSWFDPDDLVDNIQELMENMANIPKSYMSNQGITTDPGVVEIPTKILRSWDEMAKVYNRIAGEAKRFFLKPRNESDAGGDGHIHVSGLTVKERNFLYKDLINRPYLHWAFIHPYDDDNAITVLHWLCKRSFTTQRVVNGHWTSIPNENLIATVKKNSTNAYDIPEDKCCGVNYRSEYGTQEFRIFWTPKDLKEQITHMALVQSYLGWVRKQVAANEWPDTVVNSNAEAEKMLADWRNINRCKKAFGKFLDMVGLDADDYKENFARMRTRFKDYPKNLY